VTVLLTVTRTVTVDGYRGPVVARWDRAVVEAFQHLRWGPANWLFEVLSDWWVRSLLIIGIGLVADLWVRRPPLAASLGTVSYFGAGGIDELLKRAFERPRPSLVDPAVHPLIAVPHSYSMPSGHATTAFAAGVGVGLIHPRLRQPLVGLAALVALSRIWLGVHYLSDVIVGAVLGTAVALAIWLAVRAATASSEPAPLADEAGSGRRARPEPSGPGRRAR
jgi:membrane-associated phospholipid phosphatase